MDDDGKYAKLRRDFTSMLAAGSTKNT